MSAGRQLNRTPLPDRKEGAILMRGPTTASTGPHTPDTTSSPPVAGTVLTLAMSLFPDPSAWRSARLHCTIAWRTDEIKNRDTSGRG